MQEIGGKTGRILIYLVDSSKIGVFGADLEEEGFLCLNAKLETELIGEISTDEGGGFR